MQSPPPSQVSVPLHKLPSLHEVPAGRGVNEQPDCARQLSVVHGLPSLQVKGVPAVQVPLLLQVSKPLHAFPSEQEAPGVTE